MRGALERYRLALAAIVVAIGVVGGTAIVTSALGSSDGARPHATRAAMHRDSGSAGRVQDPVVAPAPPDAGTPTSLRIPQIGVSTDSLEDLTTDRDGRLLPPAAAGAAGWYGAGVVPGQVGPAIIAGHIDYSAGPGIFEHLDRLTPGDEIEVGTSTGRTLRFRVTGATESPKAQFPTSEVYGSVPDAQLRLICCAGSFDRSTAHYRDNLIVFATLVTAGS